MDYPEFIVSNQTDLSISIQKVKIQLSKNYTSNSGFVDTVI